MKMKMLEDYDYIDSFKICLQMPPSQTNKYKGYKTNYFSNYVTSHLSFFPLPELKSHINPIILISHYKIKHAKYTELTFLLLLFSIYVADIYNEDIYNASPNLPIQQMTNLLNLLILLILLILNEPKVHSSIKCSFYSEFNGINPIIFSIILFIKLATKYSFYLSPTNVPNVNIIFKIS